MTTTPWRGRIAILASLLALATPSLAIGGSTSGQWDRFAPFVFGDGRDEVVVFTAPSCPFCRQLIDRLPTIAKRYRVIVLPISFTGYDAQRVRAMACADDQEAAARAFLLHQDVILPQREPCDLRAVEARYAEAVRQGVVAVPFIIRSDGAISRGLRADLGAWLARGSEP
ncbi:MAG: thioredoxin fold domain-containing protein [Alphaproteobacteria bacterium]